MSQLSLLNNNKVQLAKPGSLAKWSSHFRRGPGRPQNRQEFTGRVGSFPPMHISSLNMRAGLSSVKQRQVIGLHTY